MSFGTIIQSQNMIKKKTKFSFMDKDSFIVFIKTDDIYKDIAEDVETTSTDEIFEKTSSFHVK